MKILEILPRKKKKKKEKVEMTRNMAKRERRRLRMILREKLFSWKISMERSDLRTNNLKQVKRM